ncbi:MAG TPA: XdhC family protein [Terracidiphilus sp.]|nr:XdhC family protein [Terracidiphilus sp.]
MTDLERILPLWRELEAAGADYVLATIVSVEGSSYRKPGARMLLSQDGRRAGTVSGGCLEAEVAQRAWWLTESGPVVERYSTVEDDGDKPYGSGCGGVVYLLLERRETAGPHLKELEKAFQARVPMAIATVVQGPHTGRRAFSSELRETAANDAAGLQPLADEALENRSSADKWIAIDGTVTRVWVDYRAARPGLWIFSAGDDARPLVRLARELGWFVAVADGRLHLATRERFPEADDVRVLPIARLPEEAPANLRLLPTDAAVVMTHSFDQDSRVLASLLALPFRLPYLGVLGPQRRTRELLAEAALLLNLPAAAERVDLWLAQLHAPTGLDLGADAPASVALSILAEIQQTLGEATGQPLRQVRAIPQIVAQR